MDVSGTPSDPQATLSQILEGPKNHFSPLYAFVVFFGVSALGAMAAATQTAGAIQLVFVAFGLGLPLLVSIGVLLIVWSHPLHLYAPSEYGQPTSAGELAAALQRLPAQMEVRSSSSRTLEASVSVEEISNESEDAKDDVTSLSNDDHLTDTNWALVFFEEVQGEKMDFERAREAFERVLAEEENPDTRGIVELIYWRARLNHGDSAALQTLRDLVDSERDQPEWKSAAQMHLGLALQDVGSPQQAEEEFSKAVAAAASEVQKARAISLLAGSQFRLSRNAAAIGTLRDAILEVDDSEAKAILYEKLGEHYQETEQEELRALALEKAVEYRPEDTVLRFQVARAYSHSDLDALSLLHYGIILKTEPTDAATLNNIGVQYAALAMPVRAAMSYRKSYENGNTLGAANLAYLYLDKGLLDDARKLLTEAVLKPTPHANVSSAIARAAQMEDDDQQKELQFKRNGQLQRIFLSEYASVYFLPNSPEVNFSGNWVTSKGFNITLELQNSEIHGKFMHESREYKFDGVVQGSCIKISEVSGTDPSMGAWAIPDTMADRGYGFIGHDPQKMQILFLKKFEASILELTRDAI